MKGGKVFVVCLIWVGIFFQTKVYAQNITLQIGGRDSLIFMTESEIGLQYVSIDSCRKTLQKATQKLIQKGYLGSSVDSFSWKGEEAFAQVHVGPIFTWASLKNQNIPNSFLNQLHLDEKSFFGKKVMPQKLLPLYEKVLTYFENNGFPFASLKLDSLQVEGSMLKAQMKLDKGPLIKIDSIYINEDAKINRSFLLNYLGLKDGMLYDESKLRAISARLRELPFLMEAYPWRMSFTVTKSHLNLYVKTKSANRADALIGLLPNNAETQGKFLLTGDIKLAFMNALGKGERFQLNWQNLQFQSPRYNLDASYPYIFKTAFGLQGKFDFYKRDSTFKTVAGELGLVYQFNANSHLKMYYEISSNRLGVVNIANLISSRRLPDNADVKYRTIGIEGMLSKVDYKLNPRKGIRMLGKVGIGSRTIIKNTTVEQTIDPVLNRKFSYLYDTLALSSYKIQFTLDVEKYVAFGKRMVLASLYRGGYSFASNSLYRNELFQIGGYRLMRGFNEGSLFVNQYHVLTLEPRFLLSLNSYFFGFLDAGIVQTKYANTFKNDFLYSGGAGMTFETKAGLFNLSYAVGASQSQAFEFKNSKIHFGYINIF